MITSYTSDKFKILSFIAILLVIYVHSSFHQFEIEGMNNVINVQHFISSMMGHWRVPLLYIISGYLFFYNVPNSFTSIYIKIKKRIKTLFIPYIITCLLMTIILTIIALIPIFSKYLNSTILHIYDNNLLLIIKSIFWNAGNGTPIAFHLWFLRDLMIIAIFTPLIYIALNRIKLIFIIFLYILAIIYPNTIISNSLLWFCIGAYLAIYPIKISSKLNRLITVIAISLYILYSLVNLFIINIDEIIIIKSIMTIIEVIAIWSIYDYIVNKDYSLKDSKFLFVACQYTFFIYLFHEPTINIFRKIIVAIIGKNSMGYLTSYLLSPWITIITLILIGSFLKKYLTKIYYVCTGNR